MTICILGGGAAGFYQTLLLLESGLPLKIIIIEKNHGNRFGLVNDGVAPDHAGTKNQAKLLRACLDDERVKYYGGIEIGKRVNLSDLQKIYPCIIDCRGAGTDIKLDVEGEDLSGVVPASKLYNAYNDGFDPFNKIDWPLSSNSKNPAIGIIGGGNVACDTARILLRNPDELTETSINPEFLNFVKKQGPTIVHLFARGNPPDCKISLTELNELKRLGFSLTASFDLAQIDSSNLSKEKRELYDYFKEIHDAPYPTENKKVLHFHFNLTIQEFKKDGKDVACTFTNRKSQPETYSFRQVIVAIGRKPLENVERPMYASGWVTGGGGSLRAAEESAQRTTEQIINDFNAGKFNHLMGPPQDQPWQLRSSVGNDEYGRILDWLEAGKRLLTVEDFFAARCFQKNNNVSEPAKTMNSPEALQPAATNTNSDSNTITVYEKDSIKPTTLSVANGKDRNLLAFFKDNLGSKAPKHQCDGHGICAECAVEVTSSKAIERNPKEKQVLQANDLNPKTHILSCTHDTQEVRGGTVKFKK